MTRMQEDTVKEAANKEETKAKAEVAVVDNKEVKAEAQASASAEPETEEKKEEKRKARRAQPKRIAKTVSLVIAEQMLFGRYSLKDVVVSDPSLSNYITLNPKAYPSTFGRRKDRVYVASHVNIVERLINKLMRGGTGQKIGGKVIRTKGALQGKKIKVTHIVERAFDTINKKTGKNPVQLLVSALENSAPIDDTTRIRYGGINYNVAVGISAARRLDLALRNVALASLIGAFKSRKSLSDALADEIILAANKDANSYAIKKKVEIGRIARSAR